IEDTIFAKARPFRSFEAGFWSVNPAAERAQSSGWRVPVALWQRPAKAAGGRTLQNHLRCREVWRRELAILDRPPAVIAILKVSKLTMFADCQVSAAGLLGGLDALV